MKKIMRSFAVILTFAIALTSICAVNVMADNDIVYDGKYNVYGFDYTHYDDATMRDGGYDSAYDPSYDYTTDWQETKYFIDENFAFNKIVEHQGESYRAPSGWDVRNLGGSIANKYFYHQALIDTSDKFPVELNRKFEAANHGRLNFEFLYVPIEREQEGATVRLYSGNKIAVSFIMHDDGIYLEQNDADDLFIGKSTVRPDNKAETSWQSEVPYNNGIRAVINMDTNTIEKIFFMGQLIAENMPFYNNVEYIDNCNINTGDQNTGELWMRGVKLYRGYLLHDQFLAAQLNVPTDYNARGSVSMREMDTGTPWDNTNMVMGTESSISKSFEHSDEKKMVFEYHMFQSQKADGFELTLSGENKDTLKFKTANGNFYYSTGGEDNLLYENYWKNVWYKLRAYIDLEKETATLYVNGIKRVENVQLSNGCLDNLSVVNKEGETNVDFFRLWNENPEPEDYCPEPQPVKPKDGIELGMQFCPMWRNGYHVGWDSLITDKRRLPYLGCYDEGDPEVNDWITKELLEHGFTFQRITVIGDTPGPYCNPTFGNTFIDEGYKYGKYSDMMPYCVLLETNSVFNPTKDYFMNYYLPYLIEHYFKDPRYFKIDGRPVLSSWIPDRLMKYAGTKEDSEKPVAEKMELCKQFVKEIRQMCIDAGVGNPIIGGNLVADEAGLRRYKEIGFDAALPYGAPSTVKGQIEAMDLTVQLKDVLDRSIAVSPGLDGSVWQAPGSAIIKSEDYRKVLEHYLSVRNKFDKDSLAYKMVCFDTYDEYGEGHWIGPSGGEGFGYLDEIYRAFVGKDPSDHTHTVPTTKQKDRFNNCYPPNRRLNTVEVVESAPEDEIEGSTVIKGWYFDDPGSTEGWNGSQIANLRVADGCLVGSVTGNDPQLYSPKLDIDYHGLIQVKVRVKYNSNNATTQNQLFYVCKNGKSWSEVQSIFGNGSWSKKNGFVEFIYPLAGPNFLGNLTQIRYDVTNRAPVDYNDAEFMIDSVELIYNKDYDTTEKERLLFESSPSYLKLGDVLNELNTAPVKVDEKLYYPIRAISYLMGAKVDYDEKNDITTVINGDSFAQIYNSEQKGYVNGGTLRANPVIVEENGTSYVTDKFFKQLFSCEIAYDEETRVISVEELSTGIEKTREIIRAFDFDIDGETEGWSAFTNVGSVSASDGKLTGKITAKNPALIRRNLTLKASDVKNIHVSFTNNTNSESGNIYFLTDTDKSWNESKKIAFKLPSAGETKDIDIDPSKCAAWGGTVTDIRFDPGSGADTGNFAIDFIRFEGEYRPMSDNTECITRTDNEIKWDFNFNSTKDGWVFSRQFGDCKVSDGKLFATVIGPSPKIYTIGDLDIDSSKLTEIELKYKNDTTGTKAKMQFMTDDENDFSKAAQVEFDIVPNDKEERIYTVPVSEVKGLDGKLNSLCFMPTDGKGTIEIDYICLVTAE